MEKVEELLPEEIPNNMATKAVVVATEGAGEEVVNDYPVAPDKPLAPLDPVEPEVIKKSAADKRLDTLCARFECLSPLWKKNKLLRALEACKTHIGRPDNRNRAIKALENHLNRMTIEERNELEHRFEGLLEEWRTIVEQGKDIRANTTTRRTRIETAIRNFPQASDHASLKQSLDTLEGDLNALKQKGEQIARREKRSGGGIEEEEDRILQKARKSLQKEKDKKSISMKKNQLRKQEKQAEKDHLKYFKLFASDASNMMTALKRVYKMCRQRTDEVDRIFEAIREATRHTVPVLNHAMHLRLGRLYFELVQSIMAAPISFPERTTIQVPMEISDLALLRCASRLYWQKSQQITQRLEVSTLLAACTAANAFQKHANSTLMPLMKAKGREDNQGLALQSYDVRNVMLMGALWNVLYLTSTESDMISYISGKRLQVLAYNQQNMPQQTGETLLNTCWLYNLHLTANAQEFDDDGAGRENLAKAILYLNSSPSKEEKFDASLMHKRLQAAKKTVLELLHLACQQRRV
jgi:hypothetical protein